MKMNKQMSELLRQTDIPVPLRHEMRLGHRPLAFAIVDGSVLLKEEYEKNKHVPVTAFPDRTGFESFINHRHFSFDGTRESLVSCLTYAAALQKELSHFLPKEFQIIVSIAQGDCSIRFHENRINETWIADDLEGYAAEAILLLCSARVFL
jgi:hypothetical protein